MKPDKERKALRPVSEDVQHSLRGGEGSIGGEEDGDEGGVPHRKSVEEVEHQLLFFACFHTLGARHCGLEGNRSESENREASALMNLHHYTDRRAVGSTVVLFDSHRVDHPILLLLHHSGLWRQTAKTLFT